jgi:uncharacterized repeat protein (TIGR03803 family)
MRDPLRLRIDISGTSLVAAVASLSFALLPNVAHAYTLKTLHSFCNETNCGDGETPLAGLLMDASGNLYGVTEQGGKYNHGLVFKLIPNVNKTKYTEHILKSFCSKTGCPGGSGPNSAGLIMDVDGDLYGSSASGGKFGAGVIFKMTPITNGWDYGVIHSFCAKTNCTDGDDPAARLAYAGQDSGALWDESSPLFGATMSGGTNNKGAVYQLTPNGSGWTYKVVHSYSSGVQGGPLLMDSHGNLFGTTYLGGANDSGTLYKLAAGTWKESTLHNFCADTGCSDGARPAGPLVLDAAGNLFGATEDGGSGSHCTSISGCGVVFERTAGGKYKVLYNFCSRANCKDGVVPSAGLVMDANGTFFGTTYAGGAVPGGLPPGGTVFSLTHDAKWTETVLYQFCSMPNCTDGAGPLGPLTLDVSGNLFGTTYTDGANGNGGTVFKLKP